MTRFEVEVSCMLEGRDGPFSEWHWQVVRHATVSDTEEILACGTEPTSEAALGKAKAKALEWYNDPNKVNEHDYGVYYCSKCQRSA